MSSDIAPVDLRPLTQQLGGQLDDGQPVLVLHPLLVPSLQERFDRLAVCTGGYLLIAQTPCQVLCCIHVGMMGVPTDHTTERLLVRPILAGHVMTTMAFLGTVGALGNCRR